MLLGTIWIGDDGDEKIGFAFSDFIIAYNVRRACEGSDDKVCHNDESNTDSRRLAHPLIVFEDAANGQTDLLDSNDE